MGKKRSLEADEQALTTKLKERAAASPEGRTQDQAGRALRRRLKRAQRKRRRLAERMRQAAPRKAEGGEAAPAAG